MLKPKDLDEYIHREIIAATVLPMDADTPTVPAAAAALGVAPAQIVKTLLFLVRGQPALVLAGGATTVDRGPLAAAFGVGKKQVRLADAEAVLRVTGYAVGGVPPFGHSGAQGVPIFLDSTIRDWDTVYAGGGDDHTLLKITVAELVRVVPGRWMDMRASEAGGPLP